MRFISSLDQHPESRRRRFPESLWPRGGSPREIDEVWTAVEFADAAQLPLDSAPTNLPPPKPDLECRISGKPLLLELGEILRSDLGEGVAHSGKQAQKRLDAVSDGQCELADSIQTTGFRSFPANASLLRILVQKEEKHYETNGLPSHLLLYYDLERPLGPVDYLLQRPDVFAALISRSAFERVWIFDLQNATVLGYLECVDDQTLRAFYDWRYHFDLMSPIQASAT